MKERYTKQITVEDFKYHSKVEVPLIDIGKCNFGCVPDIVVLNRGEVQVKYKLACRSDTIKHFYTAPLLISYPAPADILDENKAVSLSEAARLNSVFKKHISQCTCKTGWKASHCHCITMSKKCSSQCHKRLQFKNYDE